MRSRTMALVVLLCFAQVAEAKPWFKDWKVWYVVGVSVGSSIAATKQAHDCRLKFGPAPCDGGYGEFKAREIARGVGSIGLVGIGLWGRHMGIKEWSAPALSYASYNTSVAVRQPLVGCPAGEHFLYGTKFTCVENYPTWTKSSIKKQ